MSDRRTNIYNVTSNIASGDSARGAPVREGELPVTGIETDYTNADLYDFELAEEDVEALSKRPHNPISWNPVDEP